MNGIYFAGWLFLFRGSKWTPEKVFCALCFVFGASTKTQRPMLDAFEIQLFICDRRALCQMGSRKVTD